MIGATNLKKKNETFPVFRQKVIKNFVHPRRAAPMTAATARPIKSRAMSGPGLRG